MKYSKKQVENWIQMGIVCGFLVSVIYPSLIFVPLPRVVQVFLIMAFGPTLGLASVGLYFFLKLDKERITNTIAAVSNIIAGALITTMLLVQLAILQSKPGSISESQAQLWSSVNHIHYGLDVAWDVYIFVGTFLFAITMFKHPQFGKLYSGLGIVISISMIILNAISFPEPPAGAGSIDMGPFVGLWYLAVTIKILFSHKSYIKKELV